MCSLVGINTYSQTFYYERLRAAGSNQKSDISALGNPPCDIESRRPWLAMQRMFPRNWTIAKLSSIDFRILDLSGRI